MSSSKFGFAFKKIKYLSCFWQILARSSLWQFRFIYTVQIFYFWSADLVWKKKKTAKDLKVDSNEKWSGLQETIIERQSGTVAIEGYLRFEPVASL
jgi:hypothetical protein